MMSTRRTLFTLGALVAAVVLLAPAAALAQDPVTMVTIGPTSPDPSYNKLEVAWELDSVAADRPDEGTVSTTGRSLSATPHATRTITWTSTEAARPRSR